MLGVGATKLTSTRQSSSLDNARPPAVVLHHLSGRFAISPVPSVSDGPLILQGLIIRIVFSWYKGSKTSSTSRSRVILPRATPQGQNEFPALGQRHRGPFFEDSKAILV